MAPSNRWGRISSFNDNNAFIEFVDESGATYIFHKGKNDVYTQISENGDGNPDVPGCYPIYDSDGAYKGYQRSTLQVVYDSEFDWALYFLGLKTAGTQGVDEFAIYKYTDYNGTKTYTKIAELPFSLYSDATNIINSIHFVSATEIYYCINGNVKKWNGTVWTTLGTSPAFGTDKVIKIHYISSTNIYACGDFGLSKWNGTAWSSIGTLSYESTIDIKYLSASSIYVAVTNISTGETGLAYWNGATWTELFLETSAYTRYAKITYISDNQIYYGRKNNGGGSWAADNGSLHMWDGSTLNDLTLPNSGTDKYADYTKGIVSPNSNLEVYMMDYNTLAGYTSVYYREINNNNRFYLYTPNETYIALIENVNSYPTVTYNKDYISGFTDCLYCKAITTVYDDFNYSNYIVAYDNSATSKQVKIYLEENSTNNPYETGTVDLTNYIIASSDLNRIYDAYSFNGISIIRNKYIELNNENSYGYNMFVFYTDTTSGYTYCDTYLLTTGTIASNTIAIEYIGTGYKIASTNEGYLGSNIVDMSNIDIAYIYDNDQYHYIYASYQTKLITYRITGQIMTVDDVGAIRIRYNSDISQYCDIDGAVINSVVTNSEGYVLTEINKSKKLPLRPYFVNTQSATNQLHATTATDNSELFNLFESLDVANGSFRTGIKVDDGSDLLPNSDTGSNHFKFWVFALLDSGLYDDSIPYINIAQGKKNSSTNSYSLKFWSQDEKFLLDVFPSAISENITNLPHRFYNIDMQKNDNSNYIVNSKVFYEIGNTSSVDYADLFEVDAYYQIEQSILFEIQDLLYSASEVFYALDFNNKSLYYSFGIKYLNKNNSFNFNTRPSAIQEINNNAFVIVCENDIYNGIGVDEASTTVSYLASSVGLEQGNWKSLVTNGVSTFFYNKKSLWMIQNGQLINIGLPIEDYLYRNDSDNKLGVDTYNNLLYIPIDYTKMKQLKTDLKVGDYSASVAETKEYNKAFAIFDYNTLTFRINCYADDLAYNYVNFFGNINDYPVIRVGSKLVIPEYKEADGTENPLARITLKRQSMGNVMAIKKLDSLMSYLINNNNVSMVEYGIDHIRLSITLDKKYEYEIKYGDYDETATYTDTTADEYIINAVTPTNSTTGFYNIKIPIGLDFHDIIIALEIGRITDTNKCLTTVNEISIDTIQKESEKNGMF